MRSLSELIAVNDPAWPIVQDWIKTARNAVEVLPADRSRAKETLVGLQVTTRSPMGAIALETGGLLVDSGWLRILGSGSPRLPGTLLTWNGQGDAPHPDPPADAVVVAYDAVGGFFALNGGAFVGTAHGVFYFAPDSLQWEDLERGYSGFIQFALGGNLAQFYENARWPGWREDVAQLNGNQGVLIYPPLWAKGEPVGTRHRSVVPMSELWQFGRDMARQLKDLPPGSPARFVIEDKDKERGGGS